MKESRERPRFRSGLKIALAVFGVMLGACLAVLTLELPDSEPLTRFEALWHPAFREFRSGRNALRQGDGANAATHFDRALAAAAGGKSEQTVLDLVVDCCSRRQYWELARKYAWKSLQRRHRPMDELRYGETLVGGGQPAQAEAWFEKLVAQPALISGKPGQRFVRSQAEHDLAYVLAAQQKDLKRAKTVAEDGIQYETRTGGSGEMLASLNDVMAWIYFQDSALKSGRRLTQNSIISELEIARIYAQNAVEDLEPGVDPFVAASTFFHLSQIYNAEGRDSSARNAYHSAVQASDTAVRWLMAEARRR